MKLTWLPKAEAGYETLHKVQLSLNSVTADFKTCTPTRDFIPLTKTSAHSGKHINFWVYMKGKPHKYRTTVFELCEAKSGYVNNLAVYAGAHATA
jgi:hypothetical protein